LIVLASAAATALAGPLPATAAEPFPAAPSKLQATTLDGRNCFRVIAQQ
jgi:hypothetical protein